MKSIILAGGTGTRLWPLSRKNYPKQFINFIDGLSLFQLSIQRLAKFIPAKDIFIISPSQHNFSIYNQIESLKQKPAFKKILKDNVILEPATKNTLPAITLAVKFLEEKKNLKPNETIGIFPCDHLIQPQSAFKKFLKKAQFLTQKNRIVAFGVPASYPKLGYGYILAKEKFYQGYLVKKFIEKPPLKLARKLITKKAFWNAGIFCFTSEIFWEELRRYQPALYKLSRHSYERFRNKFKNLTRQSIDYGIMQKTQKSVLVNFDLQWFDLGSWDSYLKFCADFHRHSLDVNDGNCKIGKAEFIQSNNCFGYSKKRLLCFVDVNDIMAIDSQDSLLIIKKGSSEKVKELIGHIDKKRYSQSCEDLTVYRPWGYYTVLHDEKNYKVKEIGVYPGKSLSMQKHKHRSEHWNVVEGEFHVFTKNREKIIRKNQSIYVPKNTKHRIYNPTKKIAKIIEVQIGSYLGEDDIVRYTEY